MKFPITTMSAVYVTNTVTGTLTKVIFSYYKGTSMTDAAGDNNNFNNLLLIRRKLTCEYDQMRLTIISFTIRNLYNSKFSGVYNSHDQIKCWVLERGENRSTRRKTSRSRVENQQTQPTYDAESGNRTRDTLVERDRCHH